MVWCSNMVLDFELVLSGEQDAEDWISDVELWMLSMRMVTDEAKAKAMPLMMRGKAKAWFEGLEVPDRQSWKVIQARFVEDFKRRLSPTKVDAQSKVLKQDVSEDFNVFLTKFEDIWKQLAAATQLQSGDVFKIERFMVCLHPRIRRIHMKTWSIWQR
ncbi:hypothetical protein GOP47_0014030 [Adiantum capillus-veneris]|uniref:Retrotransposon gag domain-containing protein n=1 Tax=Adiantum capillus-veneris TaxID=13818 RepID=A0A9D4UPN1_ADICA|nr:hypothetical protein GOP47_0014030 [Adiantum capillus-veneris]